MAETTIAIDEPSFEKQTCPACGSEDLIVATEPAHRVEPTRTNPRPIVRFVGYTCRGCGANLRFDSTSRP